MTTDSKLTERRVANVGWRAGWWGSDGELARAVEEILRLTEDKAAPILRELEPRWPLDREDRAQLAQFLAIHAVRGSGWRTAYDKASMLAIGGELRRRRWGDRVERLAVSEFMADQPRAEAMLKDIPRVASIFMSMCWSLVKFDQPLIGSGDQPVVWFPLLQSRQRLPIEAIPRSGFMDTAEVRFPVSPWHVLLLTWAPQPDHKEPVAGEFHHAADINRSTHAQADRDWFHRPGTTPPFLAPPLLDRACEPISYDLVPGYSLQVAAKSRRRSEANRLMEELIASSATDLMRFVVVTEREPAPPQVTTAPAAQT